MKVAIDLDGVLADTRPLWDAWLADVARRTRVDVGELPRDRAEAASRLDDLVGNWRALLERFADHHAPLFFRPDPEIAAALRRLKAAGAEIGVFTDAPAELARAALAHAGAARRVAVVEAGDAALPRLLARLGGDAVVVRSREELRQAPSTPAV